MREGSHLLSRRDTRVNSQKGFIEALESDLAEKGLKTASSSHTKQQPDREIRLRLLTKYQERLSFSTGALFIL
jgi:hypothetical protein